MESLYTDITGSCPNSIKIVYSVKICKWRWYRYAINCRPYSKKKNFINL